MHYTINNVIVKSELAAKSVLQPNKYILEYIDQIPTEFSVLDYGCGKLRYSIPLSKRVKNVVAVDSDEQINKLQIVNGKKTKLADFKLKNLRIYPLSDDTWRLQKYDLAFCTNVLSAIPFENDRLELLINAKSVLKEDGRLFITVQYRNSYFSEYSKRSNVSQYNDGWLLCKNKKQYFFYAPLNSEYIVSLCEKVGFKNISVKKFDGSCYVLAQK